MFQGLVLSLAFVAVAGLTLGVYAWLLERRRLALLRDVHAEESHGLPSAEEVMILGGMTPALAGHSPIGESKRPAIQQELREAGFYHKNALTEFQAIRAVLIFAPIVVAGLLGLAARREDIPRIAMFGAVLAVLGFSIPRLFIHYRARVRAQQIERGLPIAVDLLNLGLTGGQNLGASLALVSKELQNAYPVLAEELSILREHAELSSFSRALHQFAERTNVPDVRTLAMVLTQSERLGTDLSAGLLEYSSNMRTTLRHRAEAQANRANFWMLFPTILCLWIPAVIVLFGPVYHDFWSRRQETSQLLNQSRNDMKKANSPTAAAMEP